MHASHSERPARVWYLAYGSNLHLPRLRRYLEGGDAAKGETEAGARDPAAPTDNFFVQLPFRLRFSGSSQRWSGGGVAFVDPDPGATAWFRAWNVTAEQFEDIFNQENRRPVGTPLDWAELLAGTEHEVGESWYRRIMRVPLDNVDEPALTFTSATTAPSNPPHEDYAATIRRGLGDHPRLDEASIAAYLAPHTLS